MRILGSSGFSVDKRMASGVGHSLGLDLSHCLVRDLDRRHAHRLGASTPTIQRQTLGPYTSLITSE